MSYHFCGHSFHLPAEVEQELDISNKLRLVLTSDEASNIKAIHANIFLLNDQGKILWQVEPLEGREASQDNLSSQGYTKLWLDEKSRLWAYAFLGFLVQIDIKSGRILSRQQAK